jgi:hypothetical protein
MMIPHVSPNRVVGVAIGLFVFYWVLAIFVPPHILRDVFNSLAFGTQLLVVLTWSRSAYQAVRYDAKDGAWLLVLAVFYICLIALLQRMYAISFNWLGGPQSWTDSAISGFFPYSYMIAGALFLLSPGVQTEGIKQKAWWTLFIAGCIGSFVAGALFTLSISTF